MDEYHDFCNREDPTLHCQVETLWPRWLDLARDEDLIFRIESKIDLVELNLASEINQWFMYILLIHSHSAVVQRIRYLHSRIHHDMEGRKLICHCSNVVNLPFTELNFDS